MKTVTHKLWPVSYVDDNGKQVDTVWAFKAHGEGNFSGDPFEVDTQHPEGLTESWHEEKIAKLKKEIRKLEARNG